MYPQRHPVYTAGRYTVHRGKLDRGDSRAYWIEGPAGDGRIAPLASCWYEGDAIRLADRMHAADTAATPPAA